MKIKILDGEEKNTIPEVDHGEFLAIPELQKVKQGQTVVVQKITSGDQLIYIIVDKYRIPALTFIFIFFLILGVIIGKWHGVRAILGLIVSIGIIIKWVIPQIILGSSPLWIILNSEFLAEEIVRTLVGSSVLLLAVPISTALSAYYLSKPKKITTNY